MRSRRPENTPAPPLKSVSGLGGAVDNPARCTCIESKASTERFTTSGLRLIRLRFGIHRSELPFLSPEGLKWYLLSLLSPTKSLPSLSNGKLRGFPRVFRGWDEDGFPILHRLSRSDRWELAHSCNSLARSLPPSCRVHTPKKIDSWVSRATTSPPPSQRAYLAFCRNLIRKEFPSGWDRHRYPSSVHSFCPKDSARAESQDSGGVTASDYWCDVALPGFSSKVVFSHLALKGRICPGLSYDCPPELDHPGRSSDRASPSELPSHPGTILPFKDGFHLRVKEIPTVGKSRVIGIPSLNYDLLGPLHRAIYGHLTKRSWLVHGKITPERVNAVCKGAVQTSVDLVNATDGLRLDVTEAILGALLSRSVAVPGEIKRLACESLYPSLGKKKGTVVFGQMMGTYLSFPLLCLHSYCAAKWAARGKGLRGIAINGDDALVSSDLPLGDYPEGYQKNEAKTITSRCTAELNSTVFVLRSGVWTEIRNLRRVGAETDYAGIRHMAAACQDAGPKWVSAFIRSKIGKRWGLSSTALGLSRRHRLVWLRDIKSRGGMSDLVPPSEPLDSRYVQVSSEPSSVAKHAFGLDLFDNGRSKPLKKVFNPHRTKVLKSAGPRIYIPRSSRFVRHLSYDPSETIELVPRTWFTLSPDFNDGLNFEWRDPETKEIRRQARASFPRDWHQDEEEASLRREEEARGLASERLERDTRQYCESGPRVPLDDVLGRVKDQFRLGFSNPFRHFFTRTERIVQE